MNTCPLWGTGGKAKEYFVAAPGRPELGRGYAIINKIQVYVL